MNAEVWDRLRQPFPAEVIGKLPRVFCAQCRDATKTARRPTACGSHEITKCAVCKNRMTTGHLHLDYVGHAETTDRLLQVDPMWTWEPFGVGDDGLPSLDRHGGLWIRLTVAGVTRPGYGSAGEKVGPDAMKEAIGDAIRNAAMRFGVALDLWGATYKGGEDGSDGSAEVAYVEPAEPTNEQVSRHEVLANELVDAGSDPELRAWWSQVIAAYKADEITTVQANALRSALDARRSEVGA